MKQIWTGIQLAFSALGGFIGWFLGGADGFLYALIAFVVVDYITGIMCAIADKNLSSAVGFRVSAGRCSSLCWWASAIWWTCMCWDRAAFCARR